MYTPTPEDLENIRKDIDILEDASNRAIKSIEQMYNMHIACPALTALMDSMLETLAESFPATVMADKLITGGSLVRDLRQMIAIVYLTGVNTTSYPVMLPCTEDTEGHLHEVEALLTEVASKLEEGTDES